MMADTSISDISNSRSYEYTDGEWRKRIEAVFNELTKSYGDSFINADYSKIQFEEIDNTIDFNKDEKHLSNFFNKVEEELKDPTIQGYWNESIVALYNYFKDSISKDDYEENKDDDWNKRIKSIKDANAGFSFLNDPYVKPDLNIDNDSYEDVRGDDKIESVLQNSKNMQYTHTQEQIDGKILNKYIRLLMPKYTRRVEVEDLNRNFWVIGQALGLMSAYLLDPESALNQILNAILNELGEIWNNIYELWAIVGDLCGEIYNLWLKTDEIGDQINELGSAINKTQITINLRNNSTGSSFGGTIQGDGQFYSLISYLMGPNNKGEYPKITSIEDTECYYIGGHEYEHSGTDEGVSVNSYNNFIKKYPWIQNEFFSIILQDNGKYEINLNISMDYENRVSNIYNSDNTLTSETFFNYYDIFGNKSFEEEENRISGPRKGVFFKITGTRRYSSSGLEDEDFEEYFAFDCNHPCIIDDEKMAMEILGKWYFLTGGNGIFHFPINRAIYNCSKLENEIFASETENKFCNGLFNFRRATYDRRKVAEIAYDMMEYNMYLTPMVESYPNFYGLTIGDMLTKNVEITEDLQKSVFKKFISNLISYEYSITDEFKLNSDEMAITATGLSKLYSLLKDGSSDSSEQYINSVIKHIKNSNGELAFFEEYVNFENNKNYENYSILVIKILEFFGISYSDYLEENEPLNTSSDAIEEWLRPYENWINEKEEKTDFSNMQLESFNIYMTPNPFVITGPSTKTDTDRSGGRSYIKKYGGNIEDSLFFLSIRLLPEESVLWGKQIVLNDTKSGFTTAGLQRNIKTYKFSSANDEKVIESFARSGALKGDTDSSRSAYLTPHKDGKDFSNYWIKFECPATSSQILTAGLNLGISNISFYENHTHTIMSGYVTSGQSIDNFNNIDIDIPINFLRVENLLDINLRICDFYQINSPCPTNNGILCLSPRSYEDNLKGNNFSKISIPPSFRYYVDNNKSIKGKFYNRFFNYKENHYWYITDGLLGIGKGKGFEENLSGGFYNGKAVDKNYIEDFKNKLSDENCVYDNLYNRDESEITFFRYTDDIQTDGNNSGHIMSPACYICNENGMLKESELNNNCYTKIHYMGPCSAIPMYLDHNQNNIIQNTNITWNDVTFQGINYLENDKSKKLGLKFKFYDGDVFNNWNSILFGVEISKENGLLLPKRTDGKNLWQDSDENGK